MNMTWAQQEDHGDPNFAQLDYPTLVGALVGST
jgi:hypothetical protein